MAQGADGSGVPDPHDQVALGSVGEEELVKEIARLVNARDAVVGIGDDAAVIPWREDEYQLLTVDTMVEGVHFQLAEGGAPSLGRRALGASVSDIAAMGGVPSYALVSLVASAQTSRKFVRDLFRGMNEVAERFGIGIVGGNVSGTEGPLVVDIHVLGHVPKEEVLLREGAKAGDVLAVTGSLGLSGAVRMARERGLNVPASLVDFVPEPRVTAGRALASRHLAAAAMDISDGLARDLRRLVDASDVGATVYARQLPVDQLTHELAEPLSILPWELALTAGEDYELLLTIPRGLFDQAREAVAPLALTSIGEITKAEEGLWLEVEGERRPLPEGGWLHFEQPAS